MTACEWVRQKWGERAEAALLAAVVWCAFSGRKLALAQVTWEWLDDQGVRHLCRGLQALNEPVEGDAPSGAKWMVEGGVWEGPGALPADGVVLSAGPWTPEYLRWVEYTRTSQYALERLVRDVTAKAHA